MINFMNETIKIKWVSYCITVMKIPVGKSVNAKKKKKAFLYLMQKKNFFFPFLN